MFIEFTQIVLSVYFVCVGLMAETERIIFFFFEKNKVDNLMNENDSIERCVCSLIYNSSRMYNSSYKDIRMSTCRRQVFGPFCHCSAHF